MSVKDEFSRRKFLSGLGRVGLVGATGMLGAKTLSAQAAPAAPRNLRTGAPPLPGFKAVLTRGDFQYLGSFRMPVRVGSHDTGFGRTLTHRYVNGQLRFFSMALAPEGGGQPLYEVAAPATLSANPSQAAYATIVRQWADPQGGVHGLYWDEADQRLYMAGGDTYNARDAREPSVGYATISSSGTMTHSGPRAFTNRSCKMVMGGLTSIPTWFADAYCRGRRLGAGFGGYFSVATIGPVSIGPSLSAFSPGDLASASPGGSVGNTTLVGYPFNAAPYTSPDRARRDTNYRSEFDNPPHWNPKDGVGYWSWSDQLAQGGCWVDTPTKSGLIFFPTMGNGRTWYETSTLHAERSSHAWFIYDPADLADVARGVKQEWQIQAKSFYNVQYPGLSYPLEGWADFPMKMIAGATWDALTSTLYVSVRFGDGTDPTPNPNVVHAYRVI